MNEPRTFDLESNNNFIEHLQENFQLGAKGIHRRLTSGDATGTVSRMQFSENLMVTRLFACSLLKGFACSSAFSGSQTHPNDFREQLQKFPLSRLMKVIVNFRFMCSVPLELQTE